MKALTTALDRVAAELETLGLRKLAYQVDIVANTLEGSGQEEQKLSSDSPKMLIIVRGIPGSGKSTMAKDLGKGGEVFSTDDYEGLYDYSVNPPAINGKLVPEAHAWNQKRAEEAMSKGITPVVIDNTHIQKWEARPYVEAANRHGYDMSVQMPDGMFELTSSTPEKTEELLTKFHARNQHGVPLEVLKRMLSSWEDSSSFSKSEILKSKAPWER